MNALDTIAAAINQVLAGCYPLAATTQMYGIAEQVEKDGVLIPVCTVDGNGKMIVPEYQLPLSTFWMVTGTVEREPAGSSYGRNATEIMTAPMTLFVVGHRKAIPDMETVRSVTESLADCLPRRALRLNENVSRFTIEGVSIEHNVRTVLNTVYPGYDWNKNQLDLVAGAIQCTFEARVCGGVCGVPVDPCLPVTVLDTTGDTYEVPSGGRFECTECPGNSAALTFAFADGSACQASLVLSTVGMTLASVVYTNVASATILLNGVAASVPVSVATGDTVTVEMQRTAAGAAAVVFDAEGITAPVTINATDQYHLRPDPAYLYGYATLSPGRYKGDAFSLFMDKGASYADTAYRSAWYSTKVLDMDTGGTAETLPMIWGNYTIALNDTADGPVDPAGAFTTWWLKMRYMLRYDYIKGFRVYEYGVFRGVFPGTANLGGYAARIRVEAGQVHYEFQESAGPPGVWTTFYTSSDVFAPGTQCRVSALDWDRVNQMPYPSIRMKGDWIK